MSQISDTAEIEEDRQREPTDRFKSISVIIITVTITVLLLGLTFMPDATMAISGR